MSDECLHDWEELTDIVDCCYIGDTCNIQSDQIYWCEICGAIRLESIADSRSAILKHPKGIS